MQPDLTLGTLLPPIAAATVVNVFLFAGAWRVNQAEERQGKDPWPFVVGLLAYVGCLTWLFYGRWKAPLAGWLDLFGATLISEAMGGLVVSAILHAFIFSRGQPTQNRVFAVIASALLLYVAFAGIGGK